VADSKAKAGSAAAAAPAVGTAALRVGAWFAPEEASDRFGPFGEAEGEYEGERYQGCDDEDAD